MNIFIYVCLYAHMHFFLNLLNTSCMVFYSYTSTCIFSTNQNTVLHTNRFKIDFFPLIFHLYSSCVSWPSDIHDTISRSYFWSQVACVVCDTSRGLCWDSYRALETLVAQQFAERSNSFRGKIQIWSGMKAKSWSQKFSSKPQNERSYKAPKGQSIMRLGNVIQYVLRQEI